MAPSRGVATVKEGAVRSTVRVTGFETADRLPASSLVTTVYSAVASARNERAGKAKVYDPTAIWVTGAITGRLPSPSASLPFRIRRATKPSGTCPALVPSGRCPWRTIWTPSVTGSASSPLPTLPLVPGTSRMAAGGGGVIWKVLVATCPGFPAASVARAVSW